ncbi:MAG: SCO family protein [Alphaproteobacteria bacterium]|nr:MAG: SCO family protein [Alphaproteobacteria bacterium]
MSKNTAIFIGLLAVLAILAGLANLPSRASDLIEMSFDPSFSLTDHNGQPATEKNFSDKYVLYYFGFTNCPDICPVDLQKLADAYDRLPQDKKDKLQILFITIDPERDTPKAMKQYLSNFNNNFVGLTGSAESIKSVGKGFKIYAEKAEMDHGGGHEHHGQKPANYTFNHTAMFYIALPQNKSLGVLKNELDPAALARNLTVIVH